MTDNDFDRTARAWLEDGPAELPDRVLRAALDEIHVTRQHRTWRSMRRAQQMNNPIRIWVAAAAAVVVIALVGISLMPKSGSVGGPGLTPAPTLTAGPTATATPSPSLAGAAAPSPAPSSTAASQQNPPNLLMGPFRGPYMGFGPVVKAGLLAAGTYDDWNVDGTGFNISFTVPAGWTWNGQYLSKGGIGLPNGAAIFFFGGQVQVYADPCHWAAAQPSPPAGLAVMDLMAALAAQPMRNATIPVARPMIRGDGGFAIAGMAVELTVPSDLNLADCDLGQFRSWGPALARSHQGPGQRDLVWAVDVTSPDGVFIVDAASFPGTPAAVTNQIEAILRSTWECHCG
jgi:hypothetical protein